MITTSANFHAFCLLRAQRYCTLPTSLRKPHGKVATSQIFLSSSMTAGRWSGHSRMKTRQSSILNEIRDIGIVSTDLSSCLPSFISRDCANISRIMTNTKDDEPELWQCGRLSRKRWSSDVHR